MSDELGNRLIKEALGTPEIIPMFGKWIRVEDRLPEKNITVLGYHDIYGRSISLWNGLNWIADEPVGTLPPTHWMFLPKPPVASK